MKKRAPRNRTLTCSESELERLAQRIMHLHGQADTGILSDAIINADIFEISKLLPEKFVDLLILDPPYNLSKNYNGRGFKKLDSGEYAKWFEDLLQDLRPFLKNDASIYVCSDWKTSMIIAPILMRFFKVRNRITWEREKGRGAKGNWKNNLEDIWYCSVSDKVYFDVDSVKVKRRVLAPYKTKDGLPKDWQKASEGNFRLTHPSNLWTDISIPFWSMPENTDHPTQKPEKLLAKMILASSRPKDMVFDPFLGSGTTAVVAKKLGRNYCGIEINREYCCWALKRLEQAETNKSIQGYVDGVFWERNSLKMQKQTNKQNKLDTKDLKNKTQGFLL